MQDGNSGVKQPTQEEALPFPTQRTHNGRKRIKPRQWVVKQNHLGNKTYDSQTGQITQTIWTSYNHVQHIKHSTTFDVSVEQ